MNPQLPSPPLEFHITEDVKALGVRGVFLRMSGISNKERDEEFEKYRIELAARLRAEFTTEIINADPTLEGFRTLHTAVKRSNRNYPSAPEALISLLARRGVIPTINLAVDIYNCVSLETRLALGAHDVRRIEGNVSLRITDGTELFMPLGSIAPEIAGKGEYSYVDDGNDILCRMEYKQVEKTKVTLETTDCFYIVQGHAGTSKDLLQGAAAKLVSNTERYCGGNVVQTWEAF